MNDRTQTFPPPMSQYIPPSMPPSYPPLVTQQQQYQVPSMPPPSALPSEQPSMIHYPPTGVNSAEADGTAAGATTGTATGTVAAANPANFNSQQQMAAFMQMQQQQWAAAAAGGFAAPYMMPFAAGPMMMMPPTANRDRPASRQSSRPPSRQSVNAPVSSSRSLVNGQSGGQPQASASMQNLLPNQAYASYFPPGMANPWFDPYWQMMYANFSNPYNYGYNDEMWKYMRQMGQTEDDRYSRSSAAPSQSRQSQQSSSMQTWGSMDSLNDVS